MCGFYFSTNTQYTKNSDFEDVKQRGLHYFEFNHKKIFGCESILPASTTNIVTNENDVYKMFFAGEVYNYDTKFKNDSEYVFNVLCDDINNVNKFNGMFAFVLYNKKNNNIVIGRDKTGQISLYWYRYHNDIVVSTTLRSIVVNVDTSLDDTFLDRWLQYKHYIFQKTVWHNIDEFPPGYVYQSNTKKWTYINGPRYNEKYLTLILEDIRNNMNTTLPTASVCSGGVDSSIISHYFGESKIALNCLGKDKISRVLPHAKQIQQTEWCEYVDDFIINCYNVPYTWSWIGYYIMGSFLKKGSILYTGEGADEIFGGYPDYKRRRPTPYSGHTSSNPIANKIHDQKIFIPVAAHGANLALGCYTIEARSPYLDLKFLNNVNFLKCIGKKSLKNIFKEIFDYDPPPKQGFAGFPNEYYNHTFQTNIKPSLYDNYHWKVSCMETIKKCITK